MAVRVGINGFGRIGRNFLRAVLATGADIEVVAANDLAGLGQRPPPEVRLDLRRLGSTRSRCREDTIAVGAHSFKVFAERDPKAIPWGDLGVDVVIESTGMFTDGEKAGAHLERGAPSGSSSRPRPPTSTPPSWSASTTTPSTRPATRSCPTPSCTTNCFVPMIKVLDDAFGVEKGLMTTVHAYTNDQNLLDLAHKDLRRARAAAVNIVPASHRGGPGHQPGARVHEGPPGRLGPAGARSRTARSPTSPASSAGR